KSVDATAKSKNVGVTVKATDTGSGVLFGTVTFTSPSGVRSTGGTLLRKAGAPGSGTWKRSDSHPRRSEPGGWAGGLSQTDGAQTTTNVTTAQLKTKHCSTNLTVKALDIQGPTASAPATVSHNGPVVVTFSEPTLWSGSTNPFSVFDAGTFSNVPGTWTCK